MREAFYTTPDERAAALAAARRVGEVMIHDDFLDAAGNPTDGTAGRLTFDVLPDNPPVRDTAREALRARIDDGTVTLDELAQALLASGVL